MHGLAEGVLTAEARVGVAVGVERGDLAVEVDHDVVGGDEAPALGRVLVPIARAAVEVEDVGLAVGLLGQRSEIRLHDPLFLVGPADEVVHVEPHPVDGGTEDAAVRVEEVVRGGGGRHANRAAVAATRGGLARLRLVLLVGLSDRLLRFLLRLLGVLLLGLLSLLLLHGLLLLLLLSLLLHRLLLLLSLRLLLRDRLLAVVVIVAAADQREAGGADAGAS